KTPQRPDWPRSTPANSTERRRLRRRLTRCCDVSTATRSTPRRSIWCRRCGASSRRVRRSSRSGRSCSRHSTRSAPRRRRGRRPARVQRREARVAGSPNSARRGRERPRLYTEPACKLTRRTTLGFEAIAFAEDMLGMTLLPWQQWWLKHALELEPGGSFRYRTVLTLVARQNGKTTLLKALALYFMY